MVMPKTRLKWVIVCKKTGGQVSKARFSPRKLDKDCQDLNFACGFEKYELRHVAPEQVAHHG
jgi:hypothetical protein